MISYEDIEQTAAFLRERITIQPQIGIILGTGLGDLAKRLENIVRVPYEEIPNFPVSTVQSHAGQLAFGFLNSVPVMMMEGRFHYYEGYTLDQVTFPVRVVKALGCQSLFVTNASGGVDPQLENGDILLVEDHINLFGVNPLIGPNDERLGGRFPDMSQPYDHELLLRAEEIALKHGIRTRRGVYAAMTGPCLETRAEYRMLKTLGASAIGMSTVPEVIVAVHANLKVCALAVITDMCLPDCLSPTPIEHIIATANSAGPKLAQIVSELVKYG